VPRIGAFLQGKGDFVAQPSLVAYSAGLIIDRHSNR
jgi:hypothetical protein